MWRTYELCSNQIQQTTSAENNVIKENDDQDPEDAFWEQKTRHLYDCLLPKFQFEWVCGPQAQEYKQALHEFLNNYADECDREFMSKFDLVTLKPGELT